MNRTNRCLMPLVLRRCLACLVAPLALAGAATQAANWPTLAVPPAMEGYVTVTQSPTEVTLQALVPAPNITAAGATGVSPYGNDYALRADLVFNLESLTAIGLAVRVDVATSSMYGITLNPVDGWLALTKIQGGSPVADFGGYGIAYDAGKTYTMSLGVTGNTLTGSLYDGATLLKTLVATDTDTPFTTGELGVFAFLPTGGGDTVSGTWRNPSMVPEPACLTLLGLAGGLLAMRRRR